MALDQTQALGYVVKKVRFSSAHFFHLPHLSDLENRQRFGPTANRNGHGHNYELEVTVKGPVDSQTGMVMNLKDLKALLQEEVITPLDFKSLNHDVPYFSDKLPTLENLVQFIWPRLEKRVAQMGSEDAPLSLHHLTLYEADDLFVDFGADMPDATRGEPPVPPLTTLTRKYDFCATHRLYNPSFSDEQNQTVFRECNNPNGHGHNYELEVSVSGVPDQETGMVIDLVALDMLVSKWILAKVDHKNMNLDVDFLSGIIPTAELMAEAFWKQLCPHIPEPARLYKIRLIETKKNYAEYYGP
ncbi:MAG: 6-carboxytetrahydropterin synthase [Vampirovibrionales bacterium]|nr:6-carboxytetrahydropterin synthase [Vampirovibrionales bacterium]